MAIVEAKLSSVNSGAPEPAGLAASFGFSSALAAGALVGSGADPLYFLRAAYYTVEKHFYQNNLKFF